MVSKGMAEKYYLANSVTADSDLKATMHWSRIEHQAQNRIRAKGAGNSQTPCQDKLHLLLSQTVLLSHPWNPGASYPVSTM